MKQGAVWLLMLFCWCLITNNVKAIYAFMIAKEAVIYRMRC